MKTIMDDVYSQARELYKFGLFPPLEFTMTIGEILQLEDPEGVYDIHYDQELNDKIKPFGCEVFRVEFDKRENCQYAWVNLVFGEDQESRQFWEDILIPRLVSRRTGYPKGFYR